MPLSSPKASHRNIQGRCIAIEENTLLIRSFPAGNLSPENRSVKVSNFDKVKVGDIVRVHGDPDAPGNVVEVLTPNRSSGDGINWMQRTLDPGRIKALRVRSIVESAIREFFLHRSFLETRTPLLVPSPGMETHIRPFEVNRPQHFGSGKTYLPTSPEFAMKRLLVGGLERIFQITSAFREEPRSTTHHPEFTILEWYRAYAGYEEIMVDTEELFEFIALKISGKPTIEFMGTEISVKTPWPRLRVRDLFLEKVGIDLTKSNSKELLAKECERLGLSISPDENWDDLYFKIWLNLIEPVLPKGQAVFVTRYPKSQAALSVIDQDPDGTEWARRFELYAGGLELGNAFEELTDPVEQRKRFEKDMRLRTEIYGPEFSVNAMDEEFLAALADGMPPSGGIAVGVDRMVMLFADESDIDRTLWLRSGGYTLD